MPTRLCACLHNSNDFRIRKSAGRSRLFWAIKLLGNRCTTADPDANSRHETISQIKPTARVWLRYMHRRVVPTVPLVESSTFS